MWISYSDSEVNKFHPICEKALETALELLKINGNYRVIHHQYTGSLEMDFVIQNIHTGKYLCVVEVKRTPADVHSARYQFQAMSYVQMNSGESEKPFYVLTNLEYAFAFRYDERRPRVFQQMLKPGLVKVGTFDDDDQVGFENKLAEYFKDIIKRFIDDRYEYSVTLEQFATHMEKIQGNSKRWKSHLAVLLYEYIRGAFSFVNRNDLRDVRAFRNNVERICAEAVKINFRDIFDYSEEKFEENAFLDNDILSNLYDFGFQNVSGDSVSNILHQIVSAGHEHEGEVPTDLELGRIVAVLAKHINGEITPKDYICDPAAGSGNLISTAIDVFGVSPTQIFVNDINDKLLELLSLRIGLNFVRIIGHGTSPRILNKSIAELNRDDFKGVKVVVMNPPFVAGINCIVRKQELFRKIKSLTGTRPITEAGQMPLEAVFLELVTELVEPGTTIACVFPKTHLMATGMESQIVRRFALQRFGLKVVFTYPGKEIFDEVTKDTCVLVGKVMAPTESVNIISAYDTIPNIDIHRFDISLNSSFSDKFTQIMPGVVACKVAKNILNDNIENGWRMLNSELVEAINFVDEKLKPSPKLTSLSTLDLDIKRGTAGNSGASDLLFFDSRAELSDAFADKSLVLSAGMRNAKLDSFVINGGDSQFFTSIFNRNDIVDQVIDTYISLPQREGRQLRRAKTKDELRTIVDRESEKSFSANSVLIPRNIRRNGRVYLAEEQVYVSTNFLVCSLAEYRQALVMSTWMSTAFYQLICEVSSKDQEGTRKMESGDILSTLVPTFDKLSKDIVEKLEAEKNNISFLDLQNPVARDIDRIWANELFGNDGESVLSETISLLSFLANRRNG